MSLHDQAQQAIDAAKAEERKSRKFADFDLATHRRAFVTVRELAEHLVCDRRTIIRMIANGSLPARRVGRAYRIATDDACAVFHVARHHAAS